MSNSEKLEVVNEKGEVIGLEARSRIHKYGLLHKEIHVWLYTPKGEIIFQHRAKDKDTYPDMLDASVGGHVELGDSYEESAVREAEEEAGIKIKIEDLIFIKVMRSINRDAVTGMTNNVVRHVYIYMYTDELGDLRVEKEKSYGFEAWSISKILNISEEDRKLFVPSIFSEDLLSVFRKIKNILEEHN